MGAVVGGQGEDDTGEGLKKNLFDNNNLNKFFLTHSFAHIYTLTIILQRGLGRIEACSPIFEFCHPGAPF
jgi:hypothetical protein